jgi:hypothetical protein
MQTTNQTTKGIYSEQEAADHLGISIHGLHSLLDEHIFNNGSPRPDHVEFTSSDLVLLEFWRQMRPNPKVVRMPRRS